MKKESTVSRVKVTLNWGYFQEPLPAPCIRTVDIMSDASLEDLAELVLSAFDFDFDHAFGFYDNVDDHYKSKQFYTSFADYTDDDDPLNGESVKENTVGAVLAPGKTWLFLFDYGDEWLFLVECLAHGPAEKGTRYPRFVSGKGKAPAQYPNFDDEDYEDDEDDDG